MPRTPYTDNAKMLFEDSESESDDDNVALPSEETENVTLCAVIQSGDFEHAVEILKDYPTVITGTMADGRTALHLAVIQEFEYIVQLLLLCDKDIIYKTTQWGETALHDAARVGSLDIIQRLHHVSPSLIEVTDNLGWSPLHIAVAMGFTDVVSLLLELAPHMVDMANRVGDTVLHIAVRGDMVSIITLLLNYGANGHLLNEYNESAYDVALERNKRSVLKVLFTHSSALVPVSRDGFFSGTNDILVLGSAAVPECFSSSSTLSSPSDDITGERPLSPPR